jgi:putative copper export protein
VLRPSLDSVRLFLHVMAATVWVGGQLTLAGLVPGLRDVSATAPRIVARQFNRIAWPAFAVLVLTGVWNVTSEPHPFRGSFGVTLWVKIGVVIASGAGAWLHSRSQSRAGLAVWGAIAGLAAVGAVFVGVLLAG